MKKSLLALATLTAFAGAASAQSSVTLFGIVDLAATSIKNGSRTLKTLTEGSLNTSRLGFRGVEDLGDAERLRGDHRHRCAGASSETTSSGNVRVAKVVASTHATR